MSLRPWNRSAVILCAPSSLPTTAVTATLPVTSGRPESSVSDSSPSSRSSTRWATLLMCPTQVGVDDDQDVGGHHLLADGRPGVALAHVDLDAGLDVVVHDADDVAGHAVLAPAPRGSGGP